MTNEDLFPRLANPDDRIAVRTADAALSARQLAGASAALAQRLAGAKRVAVWAEPRVETIVGVVAAIGAGAAVVPINPQSGSRELEHVAADSAPDVVTCVPDAVLPAPLDALIRRDVQLEAIDATLRTPPADEGPALILYTSGTTGPPKGVVLSRRAVFSNLDALAEVWQWTSEDVLVQALPLFHVHGLALGVLGPLRRGSVLHHAGAFSVDTLSAAVEAGGTMVFGVPTMYRRIAAVAEKDEATAAAYRSARLLVSGSAPLPAADSARFTAVTGQRLVNRYGMTETIMNTAVPFDGDRSPGHVGPPVPGVRIRLVAEDGTVIDARDEESFGEVEVLGPNLFSGYLNLPDVTAAAFSGEWFKTGDMATRRSDGYFSLVGRISQDLIKTGGFKIGAGEIEGALLEHPAVEEVAVAGRPDDDLGECIVAWVVLTEGLDATADELRTHVGSLLAAHKRPREVVFVEALPRNHMGKVVKANLP
jgi:malonyl-CoA/methylmalonyl-CoA synthetase